MMTKKIAALAIAAAPMLLLAGCSKPAQSEVRAGLVKALKADSTIKSANVDETTINALADCIAPKIMDMDKATLDAISDGEDKATSDDAPKLKTITADCAKEVVGS